MGTLKGFRCGKCNYEKDFFLGIGFDNQKEKILFECKGCKILKASILKNPKCSLCKQKLSVISEFKINYNCPKCKSTRFTLETFGTWD